MIRYYLFGGLAVSLYFEEGAEKMLKDNKDSQVDYQIVKFKQGRDDVNSLLRAYTGWNNFLELTENEYNEILELEKQKS